MNTTTDQDMVNIDALKKATMPDDFADLLSALFISGFNYSIENRVVRESVNETMLTGYQVDESGEAKGDYHVTARWEYLDGEWFYEADKSGLARTLKSGELKLNHRTADQLVDYALGRINEWELAPIAEDADAGSDEVIDDGVVEEDVIEEDDVDEAADADLIGKLKDSIDNAKVDAEGTDEQQALPAPKPRRGKKAS